MLPSKDILYSTWWNDECYTPKYWVEPIIKYLEDHYIMTNEENPILETDSNLLKSLKRLWWWSKKYRNPTIWCPFDK